MFDRFYLNRFRHSSVTHLKNSSALFWLFIASASYLICTEENSSTLWRYVLRLSLRCITKKHLFYYATFHLLSVCSRNISRFSTIFHFQSGCNSTIGFLLSLVPGKPSSTISYCNHPALFKYIENCTPKVGASVCTATSRKPFLDTGNVNCFLAFDIFATSAVIIPNKTA